MGRPGAGNSRRQEPEKVDKVALGTYPQDVGNDVKSRAVQTHGIKDMRKGAQATLKDSRLTVEKFLDKFGRAKGEIMTRRIVR